MAFDQQRQDAIFKKTDGRCHICRKRLARKNYGAVGARGGVRSVRLAVKKGTTCRRGRADGEPRTERVVHRSVCVSELVGPRRPVGRGLQQRDVGTARRRHSPDVLR